MSRSVSRPVRGSVAYCVRAVAFGVPVSCRAFLALSRECQRRCITRVTAAARGCLSHVRALVPLSPPMSNTADQEHLRALFQAKVQSFEAKVPHRFQALYPFKEGIADLRGKRASFRTIADLLNQLGVEVSHNTVARFCTQVLNGKPARTPSGSRRRKPPKSALDVKAALQEQRDKQPTPPAPIPAPSERRGPRIADPKNI